MMFSGRDKISHWLNKGNNLVVIKVVNGILASGFYFKVGNLKQHINETKYNYLKLEIMCWVN